MDNKKIVLYGAFIVIAYLLWQAWQHDYPKQTKTPMSTPAEQAVKAATASQIQALPTVNKTGANTNKGQQVKIKTDVLDIVIDTQGGRVIGAKLPDYPAKLHATDTPYVLFNDNPQTAYYATSALVSKQGPSKGNKPPVYQVNQNNYQLKDGQDTLQVPMTWQHNGIKVTKVFSFKRGSYDIHVNYNIDNKTSQPWEGHLLNSLTRTAVAPEINGGGYKFRSYFGPSISVEDKPYEKVKFGEMQKRNLNQSSKGGWIAMQEHYFLSAWAPSQDQNHHFYSRVKSQGINGDKAEDLYTIGMVGPELTIAPNSSSTLGAQLYVGPEIASNLKAVAPHLELTIDYGWLWFISVIIFWLMNKIYLFVGNWGWSIVIVTILIKLLFYKLSASSFRSMEKMRDLAPKLKALKERYGDNREQLSRATMELYKKEKANPLGGCLPILVQIPVFIALYWVLIESVQLRQAPFILWIHDLSSKDPYYILPILFGAVMLLQQKIQPPQMDPMQAKMMMLLPVVMTVLFLNFPSGLVLYMVVNTMTSALQQWIIRTTHAKSKSKLKNGKQKTKKLKAG